MKFSKSDAVSLVCSVCIDASCLESSLLPTSVPIEWGLSQPLVSPTLESYPVNNLQDDHGSLLDWKSRPYYCNDKIHWALLRNVGCVLISHPWRSSKSRPSSPTQRQVVECALEQNDLSRWLSNWNSKRGRRKRGREKASKNKGLKTQNIPRNSLCVVESLSRLFKLFFIERETLQK